jgi:hypothetical protein
MSDHEFAAAIKELMDRYDAARNAAIKIFKGAFDQKAFDVWFREQVMGGA